MLTDSEYTNSIGMTFHRIEDGTFLMGNDRPLPDEIVRLGCRRYGEPDERPVHEVDITKPYYLATTVVTNAQYEEFDPEHAGLRGKLGFSTRDNEAAVFVSWHDAVQFCEWLSDLDNMPYRLPTEAEWEFACRAGSKRAYSTGDTLSKEFHNNNRREVCWYPRVRNAEVDHPVELRTNSTPANRFGLRDMHGLVEEWCHDWYGPYYAHTRTDPIGPWVGDFRVLRGGAHSTEPYYLRSSARGGTLPDERSWYIGFRVAIGEMPPRSRKPTVPKIELYQNDVTQSRMPESRESNEAQPVFVGPRRYVTIPRESWGPLYSKHNHDSGFTACPNGDLMAIWYSGVEENGRELCIAGARLRRDPETGRLADTWDDASVFWNAPNRNNHCPSLWSDGGRMFHFNGLSAGATRGPLTGILRTSDDNGATWSPARIIMPEHGPRHMMNPGVFRLSDGTIVMPCDGTQMFGDTEADTCTALWLSEDGGETWKDAGGDIAGIHAGVVELSDGRIMAFGRGRNIDDMMACSISGDRGATWEYSASPFPGVTSGQRIVLMRVQGETEHGSNPLILASFSNIMGEDGKIARPYCAEEDVPEGLVTITDESGAERSIYGLFAAVSFDDGETWPFVRPLSDGPTRLIEGMDSQPHVYGPSHGEYRGYCAGVQAQDGRIHVISSMNHYEFNLAWACSPAPAVD